MTTTPMKKAFAAILAVGALSAVAAPALAQPYGGSHGGRGDYGDRNDRGYGDRNDRGDFGNVRARVDQVLAKVDRALRSDRLSRSERASLSYRAQKLGNMQRQYERGGLQGWERDTLLREANDLDNRVDRATRDGGGYRRH